MGSRINTVMQPCFFQLAGILPADEAITRIKGFVEKTYAKRGEAIVARNFAAIDHSLERLAHVPLGGVTNGRATTPPVPDDVPDFVARITSRLMAGDGDLLPVSALPVDGTFPTGTTKYEKRAIAQMIPIWDPAICIDCGKCAMVCPHATIRMKVFPTSAVEAAPADFLHKEFRSRDLARPSAHDPGRARRLHRLRRLRRRLPRQEQDRHEPQGDQHGARRRAPRRRAPALGLLPVDPAARSKPDPARYGQGLPGPRAAVRVLGRVRRLRRDAVHPPRQPALRRPDDRRQRDRLLVDLRRQPADDAVDGQRGRSRPGLEQLAVRGQRRVRPRDAARARRPDRPRPAARSNASPRSSARTSSTGSSAPSRTRRPTSCSSASGSSRLREALARHRRPARLRRPAPARPRRRSRPPGRLDHRRRRLGLRHRLRRRRPGPLVRSQRQHPRPRHRGLLEHRRPGLEGDAARRRRQVRGRRQGHGQEGPRRDRPFVRQRLRRPGLDGRERPPDDEGAARGRCLAGSVARHRLQHLHRPRDRHEQVDDPPEGRGQEWLLAALPLPPLGDRRRQAVQARLVDPVDPDRRLRRDRDALRRPPADASRNGRPSSPPSPRPTPTSVGATTNSSRASNAPFPTSIDPTPRSCPRSRATRATATRAKGDEA